MIRLYILCEGKTENLFVKRVLAPDMAHNSIAIAPVTIETRRGGQRGGVTLYSRVRNHLDRLLRQDRDSCVTTMLDLYALPNDFPEFGKAAELPDPIRRVAALEKAFAEDIGDQRRFVPHIQLHEFEGLLFSDISVIHNTIAPEETERNLKKLQAILENAGSPELIDDGRETAPSRRIESIYPSYNKAAHGPQIAVHIGLSKIRSMCPHFDAWVTKLESLPE